MFWVYLLVIVALIGSIYYYYQLPTIEVDTVPEREKSWHIRTVHIPCRWSTPGIQRGSVSILTSHVEHRMECPGCGGNDDKWNHVLVKYENGKYVSAAGYELPKS
jgi:hypothetical protein